MSENGTVLANCHFIQHTMIFAREKMPMFSDKTIDIPHESSGSWNFTCIIYVITVLFQFPNLDILYIHGTCNNVLISCVLHCFFHVLSPKNRKMSGSRERVIVTMPIPSCRQCLLQTIYMGIFSRCVPFKRII